MALLESGLNRRVIGFEDLLLTRLQVDTAQSVIARDGYSVTHLRRPLFVAGMPIAIADQPREVLPLERCSQPLSQFQAQRPHSYVECDMFCQLCIGKAKTPERGWYRRTCMVPDEEKRTGRYVYMGFADRFAVGCVKESIISHMS